MKKENVEKFLFFRFLNVRESLALKLPVWFVGQNLLPRKRSQTTFSLKSGVNWTWTFVMNSPKKRCSSDKDKNQGQLRIAEDRATDALMTIGSQEIRFEEKFVQRFFTNAGKLESTTSSNDKFKAAATTDYANCCFASAF